jgi:DNA repair exonuclease SbcCD ATPase subunit
MVHGSLNKKFKFKAKLSWWLNRKSKTKNKTKEIKKKKKREKHTIFFYRSEQQKRETAHAEVQRLNDAIRASNSSYEEAVRQERTKREELHNLIRSVEEREREHDDARKALNRVRKEIEKEENKLNKVSGNYVCGSGVCVRVCV